jgi:biotin synthase-related radical SAM superfamily protein
MESEGSSIISLKAKLLSAGLIKIRGSTLDKAREENRHLSKLISDNKNLCSWPWLFIKLDQATRVRLIVDPTLSCDLELTIDDDVDFYSIRDKSLSVLAKVTLEDSLYHCPEQLFFNLYTWCSNGCEFCPLAAKTAKPRDTIERMISVAADSKKHGLKGIGITTGIPAYLTSEKLIDELARAIAKLRKVVGNNVPIGVSPFASSRSQLELLFNAGADELRINSETFNRDLFSCICPDKNLDDILESLHQAVGIFGVGKVSSNIIVGLGENDDDVRRGIDELCNLKVIPTLYPLDPIPGKYERLLEVSGGKASRPEAKRLLKLAKYQWQALLKMNLDPSQLRTMCPACSASHIMAKIDQDSSFLH